MAQYLRRAESAAEIASPWDAWPSHRNETSAERLNSFIKYAWPPGYHEENAPDCRIVRNAQVILEGEARGYALREAVG